MLKLATKFVPERPSFEQAFQAGFRCAEIRLDAAVLARWEEVAAIAQDFPMEYALHFPNRTDLPPESLGQCVNLYRALGCRAVVIHQPLFDRFHTALFALDSDLRLAVENHVLTLDQFRDWAEQSPGLTLDVEHLWMLTLRGAPLSRLLAELREFLISYSGKLRHVHLPGHLPGYREHRPMYCSRDMVFGALSLLDEFQFDGLIVSEADEEFQNPRELRMDVLLFEAWACKEGSG